MAETFSLEAGRREIIGSNPTASIVPTLAFLILYSRVTTAYARWSDLRDTLGI